MVVNNTPVKERIFPVVILLASFCLSIYRLYSPQKNRKPLSFYEKSYSKELSSAYTNDAKSRRKLLEAVRFYNENRSEKAIKLLTELKNKRPSVNELKSVLLFLALCYTDYGFLKEAVNEYKQLLAIDPHNSTVFSNIGLVYQQLGEYGKAGESFVNAIEANPENAYPYNNLAQLYFKEQEYE